MRDNIHIFWSFNNGGAENLVLDILQNQSSTRQNMLVVINADYDNNLVTLAKEYAMVLMLNRKKGSKIGLLKLIVLPFLALIFSRCFLHNTTLLPFILTKSKTYVVVHGYSESLTSKNLKQANVIAVSQSLANYLNENGFERVQLIRNGIDFRKINFAISNNLILRIACVGRLVDKIKGQSRLLEALAYMPGKFQGKLSVDFIGDGKDLEELKYLSHKLGVSELINWKGNLSRSDVLKTLPIYDLVVFTSYHETFGISLVEAIASGCGVITSSARGFLEITEEGLYSDGIFESNRELSDLIIRYYDSRTKPSDLILRRDYVINNYSIEKTLIAYSNL